MEKNAFDNEKYLSEQTQAILDRVGMFDNKLYLEFGGKLIFDYHAARVLPGFDPNVKMRLLQKLKDKADIVLCIYSGDIERRKVRADFGITYDVDALKLIDDLRDWGLTLRAVIITRFQDQPAAKIFKNKLERRDIKVYTHRYTKGYPTDIDLIVSDEGYGANDYIETENPLVVITGPGPGSGKLATCLSQLYHDYKRGIKAGYAKFETFPVWNFLEAYGETTVNYNRDVEIFPVLRRILDKITGSESMYKSPTDMGVNRAGFGIIDDEAVKIAAKQEIIRRFFRYNCEYVMGFVDKGTVERVELLMDELDVKPEDRRVVEPARKVSLEAQNKGKGNEGVFCGAAIELRDSSIVTGKNSTLMHAASSLILNAIKTLAGIPDKIHLLSPSIIESIGNMKKNISGVKTVSLDLEETLIALSISAAANTATQLAIEKLKDLQGCEVHMTHIPTPGDEAGLRRLGVNLTSDPNFSSKSLFVV